MKEWLKTTSGCYNVDGKNGLIRYRFLFDRKSKFIIFSKVEILLLNRTMQKKSIVYLGRIMVKEICSTQYFFVIINFGVELK